MERAAAKDLERRTRHRILGRYLPKKLLIETFPVSTDVDLVTTGLGQQVAVWRTATDFKYSRTRPRPKNSP